MTTDLEIWKDVPSWDGLYQASNLGRIRSISKTIIGRSNRPFPRKGKVLSVNLDKDGYCYSTMRNCERMIKARVHRVICETFIPNPENKPSVNHKNGIKTDNRVENLEWATVKENNVHAYDSGIKVMPKGKDCYLYGKTGKDNPTSKKISQFDLNDNFIKTYDSLTEAVKENGFNSTSNISVYLSGKSKHAYGYKWKLETNEKTKS